MKFKQIDFRIIILAVVNLAVSILLFIGLRYGWGPDGTEYFLATFKLFEPQKYGNCLAYFGPIFLFITKILVEFTPDQYIFVKIFQHMLGFICPFLIYAALAKANKNIALIVSLMFCLDFNSRFFFAVYSADYLSVFFLVLLLFGYSNYITVKVKKVAHIFWIVIPSVLLMLTKQSNFYVLLGLLFLLIAIKMPLRQIMYYFICVIIVVSVYKLYTIKYDVIPLRTSYFALNSFILRGWMQKENGPNTEKLGLLVNNIFYEGIPTDAEISKFWPAIINHRSKYEHSYARDIAISVLVEKRNRQDGIDNIIHKACIEGFRRYYKNIKNEIYYHFRDFHKFIPIFKTGMVTYNCSGTRDQNKIENIQKKRSTRLIPEWVTTSPKKYYVNYAQWSPVLKWPLAEEERFFYYDSCNMHALKVIDWHNRIFTGVFNRVFEKLFSKYTLFVIFVFFVIMRAKFIKLFMNVAINNKILISIMALSFFLICYIMLTTFIIYTHDKYRSPYGVFYFILVAGFIYIILQMVGDEMGAWKMKKFKTKKY